MTFMFRIGLVLMLVLGCISCLQDDAPKAEERVRVGDKLPRFDVVMNDGSRLSTSRLEGKVSVLVFFSTGCPDCRKELPVVQQLYDIYKDNAEVEIACISRAEGENSIKAYWQEQGLTLPYSAQTDRTVYELFCTTGIPRIYIASPSSTVQFIFTDNPLATLDDLRQAVASCL